MSKQKLIRAFVLMPFDNSFNDTYQLGIKAASTKVGIVTERLDEQIFVEGMIDRIYRQIEIADIVIADMTGKNPNVFYEVGFAHAKEKICILITDRADDIPFDLKNRQHIVYNNSISFLRDELIKYLEWAKEEVETKRNSQIRLVPSESGSLETNKYHATATLDFQFNMHNDSNRSSPEIHSIYFYLGKEWEITQNGILCSQTSSDLADYKYCHYITPPVKVLAPKTWAQFNFRATRIIAQKWQGDEIKNQYNLKGHCLLRIATTSGVFDYKRDLSVKVEAIPF